MQSSVKPIVRIGCWALLAIGLASVLYRIVGHPDTIDFRFFWLAGRLWAMGIDPYTSRYEVLSHVLMPAGNKTSAWVYPPHWWPICILLAQVSLDHAALLWRLASMAMLIGGTWWLSWTLPAARRDRAEIAAAASGVLCLIEPTANLLTFGQAGAPLYLGLCALAVGAVKRSTWTLALAALLISLKPPIAVPVILAMLIVPRFRPGLIFGGAIALLISLPQLIPHGIGATIGNWLGNLSHYTDHTGRFDDGPNSVLASTGPLQLIARLLPIHPSAMIQLLLATVVAAVAGVMMREESYDRAVGGMLLLIVGEVSLLPLHIYDYSVILIPLILLLKLEGRIRWPVLLILALTVRPAKIEGALHVPIHGGVSAGTIGLSIAGMLLLLYTVARLWRREPADQSGWSAAA